MGLLAGAPLALALGACGGSRADDLRVTVNGGTPVPPRTNTVVAATAMPGVAPFTPTPPASVLDPDDLHGFVPPIQGACLPSQDSLMPNSPREYRNGVSEGVDFYFGDSCVVIERGTPVVAAFAGVVTRADHDYRDLTLADVEALDRAIAAEGTADAEAMDTFRGRQVWIDHGNGVVTRYCRLNSIAAEIGEGISVEQGQAVGGVGESGTPESVTAPGTQLHLHWEVWVDDAFLGAGNDPSTVRALYQRLFDAAEMSGAG